MGLKRNLKIVWDEATGPESGRRRFLAQALNGGPGWQVFDQKKDRFLKNKKVARMTPEEIREPWLQ